MESKTLPEVTIYTDGGCVPNPGPGGWAAILIRKGRCREISGAEPETTNNRMELTAAIRALESLKKPSHARIFTDSEYLKRGITEWMPQWKIRNWKRKGGPLLNIDLWQRLDDAIQRHRIEWRWVRGHSGIHENERCDLLVSLAIARLKTSPKRFRGKMEL